MLLAIFKTKAQASATVNALNAVRRDIDEGKTFDDTIKRDHLFNGPNSSRLTLSRWLSSSAPLISKSKSGSYLRLKEPQNMAFHANEDNIFIDQIKNAC